MSVHVHELSAGRAHTDEHIAAKKLKRLFEKEWGDGQDFSDNNAEVHIFVQPNMRGIGKDVEEIDLFVAIDCSPPFAGELSKKHDIPVVLSMFIVVELKGHSHGVRFYENGEAEVPYNSDYSSATGQNKRQCNSVQSFLGAHFRYKNIVGRVPWISRVVWFDGYSSSSYKYGHAEHRLVFSDLTVSELVRRAGMGNVCIKNQQGYKVYKASEVDNMCSILVDCLSVPDVPSALDRRRMDAISSSVLQDQNAKDDVGVIFSGYGGTGKTFAIVSTAIREYMKRNRVLLLTFNLVLAWELRRMISMMEVDSRRIPGSDAGSPCITVQTLSSWVKSLAVSLGLTSQEANLFPANDPGYYRNLCLRILTELKDNSDPLELRRRLGEPVQYEGVFIDEAQDVPTHEKDIILAVFGIRFWVSDGLDQCFRSMQPADWRRMGLEWNVQGGEKVKVRDLKVCHRLQSNLCNFVNRFASAMGLNHFELISHNMVVGGRVIVHKGAPEVALRDYFPLAFEQNKQADNFPIDILICADSGLLIGRNSIKETLLDWNYKVWDGTVREEDLEQMREDEVRLVFLDHCRGLEGYTVFLLGLDTFYERHVAHLMTELSRDGVESAARSAAEEAAKKFMTIPLTRAMHTLVVHVNNPASTIGRILSGLRGDYIEHR